MKAVQNKRRTTLLPKITEYVTMVYIQILTKPYL